VKTWLLGFVLALAAVAVLLARESPGKPRGADPTPASTPTASTVARAFQPVVAATPTAAPTPRPTAVPTSRPTAAPTRVPTIAPTPRATTAPTLAPTLAATPTSAPVPTSGARVALTFDAGADRGYAEDILDLLKAEHVVASFAITGQWARANGDLVRRMTADGHLVFNHTLDHRSFTGTSDNRGGLSPAARRQELTDADAIIGPLIGHSTAPYYRLPYGDDDARVATDVAPAGYSRKVGWTVDSMGWRGLPAADIVTRCLSLAAPGAVYVFHVGRASQDSLALARIVGGLKQHGFGFRRVDDS
jgi:peptidoglycan-N-acetylglucosamine deacetylase